MLWGVASGAVAVRITLPSGLIIQPCASTSCLGGLGLEDWEYEAECVVGEFPAFPRPRVPSSFSPVARVPKSSCTTSGLNISLGLCGKPPRPVIVNLFSPLAVAPPDSQVWAICVEASTISVDRLVKPRVGSTSGVVS